MTKKVYNNKVLSAERATGLSLYNQTAVLKPIPSWIEARMEKEASSAIILYWFRREPGIYQHPKIGKGA